MIHQIIETVVLVTMGISTSDYLPKNIQIIPASSRYCGAYTIWHWLNINGDTESIKAIVNELGVDSDGTTNVYDIVTFLHKRGYYAKAIQADRTQYAKWRIPFIPYLSSMDSRSVGHFFLCVPQDEGILVLDGAKDPYFVNWDELNTTQIAKQWNGTAILLHPIPIMVTEFFTSWRNQLFILLGVLGIMVCMQAKKFIMVKEGSR